MTRKRQAPKQLTRWQRLEAYCNEYENIGRCTACMCVSIILAVVCTFGLVWLLVPEKYFIPVMVGIIGVSYAIGTYGAFAPERR